MEDRRFIRLWSSSSYLVCDSPRDPTPRASGKKEKQSTGCKMVRSCKESASKPVKAKNGSPPATSSSKRRPGGGGTVRIVSSAGPSRQRHHQLSTTPPPIIMPRRAQSSLGFRENPLPRPQGFDLQGYMRRCGSRSEIRIGVNGSCSSDEYFEQYLKECEESLLAVGQEQYLPSGPCSMADFDALDTVDILEQKIRQNERSNSKSVESHLVPLCWEDQLKKAEPEQIMPRRDDLRNGSMLLITSVPLHKRQPESHGRNNITEEAFRKLTEKISITVKWKESYLLSKVPLRQLQALKNTKDKVQRSSSALSRGHRVCVIPQADLEEGEEGEGERGRGKEEKPEEEWSVTDIEADANTYMDAKTGVPSHNRDNFMSQEEELPNYEDLSVHFYSVDPGVIKVFSAFTFRVSLSLQSPPAPSPPPTPSFSRTVTTSKPLILSSDECVLNVRTSVPGELERPGCSWTWKLAITCSSPRVEVVRTELMYSFPLEKGEEAWKEEVDEDKTDLDVLAAHFPDLCMLELMSKTPPTSTTPTLTPAVSPAHQQVTGQSDYSMHLENLNNVASKYNGNSLLTNNNVPYKRNGGGHRVKMVHSTGQLAPAGTSNESTGTKFRLRSLYRPAENSKPRSVQHGQRCAPNIKHRLRRYCTT